LTGEQRTPVSLEERVAQDEEEWSGEEVERDVAYAPVCQWCNRIYPDMDLPVADVTPREVAVPERTICEVARGEQGVSELAPLKRLAVRTEPFQYDARQFPSLGSSGCVQLVSAADFGGGADIFVTPSQADFQLADLAATVPERRLLVPRGMYRQRFRKTPGRLVLVKPAPGRKPLCSRIFLLLCF